MANFNEMADLPIEIEVAGKKLKARRPNLKAIFGELEAGLVSKAIRTINQAAKEFKLEGSDRVKFLSDSMRNIPSGMELQSQAQGAIGSVEGTTMLLRHVLEKDQPDITDEEIMQLVLADSEGAAEWMAFLTGDRKKRPEPKGVIPS